MTSKVKTFAFLGVEAIDVDVQVKISPGGSYFTIVGLGDKAVAESKERIRAAITSMGLEFPYKRITVNLAPADLVKEGSHYDLAIALGLLMEMGVINKNDIQNYYCLGELSLDGYLAKVNGILPASISANSKDCGIICPEISGSEALQAGNKNILAATNLISIINHFKGTQFIPKPQIKFQIEKLEYPDLKDIKGQEIAKRALEIAAAGGHNLLMIGPPGTGKSMLAARLPGIMPSLNLEEILEINMIHSISGKLNEGKLVKTRPFRDPHHSCSMPAMVGGGSKAKPGEISLAHGGILFLDELAEFPRIVLDSLRQPLENGNILISRVNCHINYPANFQLIAAMNPCKCGYLLDKSRNCNKAPRCAVDYKSKISGPFMDRIDIVVEVNQIDIFSAKSMKEGESSKDVAIRVKEARQIQDKRYKNEEVMKNISAKINAKAKDSLIEKYVDLNPDSIELLKKAVKKMKISMRSYSKILRVARTIADLDQSNNVERSHILEALSYRSNNNTENSS